MLRFTLVAMISALSLCACSEPPSNSTTPELPAEIDEVAEEVQATVEEMDKKTPSIEEIQATAKEIEATAEKMTKEVPTAKE